MSVPIARLAGYGRHAGPATRLRWPFLPAVAVWSGVSALLWLTILSAVVALRGTGDLLN